MDLSRQVADAWKSAMDQGHEKVVLLCDARLRPSLARMLTRTLPMLSVVAYDEIVLGTDVLPVATIGSPPTESPSTDSTREMATV